MGTATPDARPAFWLRDVEGASFLDAKAAQSPAFDLHDVRDRRAFGSRRIPDLALDAANRRTT